MKKGHRIKSDLVVRSCVDLYRLSVAVGKAVVATKDSCCCGCCKGYAAIAMRGKSSLLLLLAE